MILALAVLAPHALGDLESPSFAPSTSPALSYIVVDQFEWDLESVGTAEISLTEESDTSEMKLFSDISIRDSNIQAFESACTTPIPSALSQL